MGKILVDSLLPGGHSPAQGAKWPQRNAMSREEEAVELTELVRIVREEGPGRDDMWRLPLVPSPLGLWISGWGC